MSHLTINPGTIFEFKVLAERISKIHTDDELATYGLSESQTFIYFFLQQYFLLSKEDAIDSIVDGSNDFGVDAVYIDDDGNHADVYLIQSKYYQSEDKFNRPLEAAAIEKMILAVQALITNPGSMPQYANSQLANKLENISSLGASARYHVLFISNSFPPSEVAISRMQDFVDQHNHTSEFISWQHFCLGDLAAILPKNKESKVDGEIQLTGSYMLHDIGLARAVIGRVNGDELVRLVQKHGDLLFEKNVRGYLRKTNQVNKRIRISASSTDAKKFFFLNNGVTIVCNKFDFNSGLGESPKIHLSNFQIVNGGQTTNAISEVAKEGKLDKNVSVLMRVVETSSADLLGDITEATNSQTLVSNRDLHSNDPIQKLIEEYLDTKDYYYESRRNKYQGEKPAKRRVDADKAAQTYYAYHFQKPADAKSKKSKLFESLYPVVFDQDEFSKDIFLFSYLLYKRLYDARNKFNSYAFLRDAELTSLALFKNNSKIHSVKDLENTKQLEKDYTRILDATQSVISEESARKGDSFEKRRFFIAQDTLGRIQEKLG